MNAATKVRLVEAMLGAYNNITAYTAQPDLMHRGCYLLRTLPPRGCAYSSGGLRRFAQEGPDARRQQTVEADAPRRDGLGRRQGGPDAELPAGDVRILTRHNMSGIGPGAKRKSRRKP